MPKDVRLQSLDFKTNGGGIASVKVNLSNGTSSQVFEKNGIKLINPQTINFDLNRPIKGVQGYDGDGTYQGVCTFNFLD